ncbi:hypothetical protein J437_LFUL019098 [Ladona fulva]|uniref:C2H2-type domain-containing protein n=1 Tax=Ladona fulva TaxID=123851 RepID=A0A8K0KR97_LADFU|nr:hypothetical protein J437_LFUL019098 [Ladona fulva]
MHAGERNFECDICGSKFFTRSTMSKHRRDVHIELQKFKCRFCSFRTKYKFEWKKHENRKHPEEHFLHHSKPFKCLICDKGFSKKSEKRDHEAMHAGQRNFECDICGSKFFRRNTMTKHRWEVHIELQKFKCRFCSFRTKYKFEWKRHENRKHRKELQGLLDS